MGSDRTALGRKLERAIDLADRPLVSRRQIRYSLRNEERNGLADQLSNGSDGFHDTESKNLGKYDKPTGVVWLEQNLFNKKGRGGVRSLVFCNLRIVGVAWRVLLRLYQNIYIPNKQVRNGREARTLAKLLRPLRKKEHQGQKLGVVHVDLVQALRSRRETLERTIVPSSSQGLLRPDSKVEDAVKAEAKDPPAESYAEGQDCDRSRLYHADISLRIESEARTRAS